ncbi:MAG: hypothetical protein AB1752_11940 [Candidatus Zixiibacteriota bacterium]
MSEPDSQREPFRVLFVCTGNTCRSPMAEGILRRMLADRGDSLPPIDVRSAGTGAMTGAPATAASREVAAQNRVDLHEHKSQRATRKLLQQSDLVFGLAAEHVEYALKEGARPETVFLLRAFPERPANWQDLSIIDPIGQQDSVYQSVFFQIDEAIHQALPEIIARARKKAESAKS